MWKVISNNDEGCLERRVMDSEFYLVCSVWTSYYPPYPQPPILSTFTTEGDQFCVVGTGSNPPPHY